MLTLFHINFISIAHPNPLTFASFLYQVYPQFLLLPPDLLRTNSPWMLTPFHINFISIAHPNPNPPIYAPFLYPKFSLLSQIFCIQIVPGCWHISIKKFSSLAHTSPSIAIFTTNIRGTYCYRRLRLRQTSEAHYKSACMARLIHNFLGYWTCRTEYSEFSWRFGTVYASLHWTSVNVYRTD